ncbi:DUF1566 domain-containing protein, partial [bacterium]|nr:DUF1566 domain-containing protein [bacterium]
IKALGESDTCSTGWDCGAYILAHHKLFDGETGSSSASKTPAEITAEKLAACAGASTCKISDDLTLSKIGDYWTTPTMTDGQWGVDPDSKILADDDNECYVNGSWEASTDGYCYGTSSQDGAKKYCESQGLRLPTVSELQTLQSTCSTNGLGCYGWFWSSELGEGNEHFAYRVNFNNGDRGGTNRGSGDSGGRAVCVGN